jgi:hypothetical protein
VVVVVVVEAVGWEWREGLGLIKFGNYSVKNSKIKSKVRETSPELFKKKFFFLSSFFSVHFASPANWALLCISCLAKPRAK